MPTPVVLCETGDRRNLFTCMPYAARLKGRGMCRNGGTALKRGEHRSILTKTQYRCEDALRYVNTTFFAAVTLSRFAAVDSRSLLVRPCAGLLVGVCSFVRVLDGEEL